MTDLFRASGPEFLVNSVTLGSQGTPTITSLASGGFVVSWTDHGGDSSFAGIKAQIFNASGVKVGSEFLVNTVTVGSQVAPTITSLASGGFVVSWTDLSGIGGDASYEGIKAQIFNASGVKVGSEFLVNIVTVGTQVAPTITSLASGGFVVSWTDFSGQGGDSGLGEIKAQIFNASGVKVGSEFLVNTVTLSSQVDPIITGLASGGFVVSWTDFSGQGGDSSEGVKAQIFNASGVKVGSEFLVNTVTLGTQAGPTITSLASGGFVVSWTDYSSQNSLLIGGPNAEVRAQIFNASGVKVGSEFLVNTVTVGVQSDPTITSLASGGFVVSWTDNSGQGGDSSNAGVKAQIFNASGVKLGSEFLVNNVTLSSQSQPTITGLASGGFVVSWTDASGQGGDSSFAGIKAKIFNAVSGNEAPTGSVTIAGNATEDQQLTASNTLADADGLGVISYQWLRGGVAVAGATGSSYTLGQEDVGKSITVAASYTDQHGTAERVTSVGTTAVVNVNDAPTGSVTIAGNATEDQQLTAANTLADADGLGAISYQWLRGGVAVAGATGSSYTLGQEDVGKSITVAASYTDQQGTAERVTTAGTTAVANVNDAPTGSVTITGNATEDQQFTASNTLADADGLGTISYQWLRGGVAVAGATGSSYTLGQEDVGKSITLAASYTDQHGTVERVTSAGTTAVANVNDAPTGSVAIAGTAAEDRILTASNTLADADGLGTISYQWLRAGVAVTGATGASYTLSPADVGHAITVAASYTDQYGTGERVISTPTAAVAKVTFGTNGADTFNGTQGNDAIYAQGGNDTIIASSGNDFIYGGDGIDTAIYAGLFRSYEVAIKGASGTVAGGSKRGTDTLDSIEILQFKDGKFVFDVNGVAAQVTRLYDTVLKRAPDQAGLDLWVDQLEIGAATIKTVATGFLNSAEFQAKTGSLSNAEYVEFLYVNALGRASDAEGKALWVGQLDSGKQDRADLLVGFSESVEHRGQTAELVAKGFFNTDDAYQAVSLLYDSFAGRLPDAAGLISWAEAIKSGSMTIAQVANGFANSPEFQKLIAGMSHSQLVDFMYQNTLDRAADAAGKTAWVQALDAGLSDGDLLMAFSQSQEHFYMQGSHITNGIDYF